MQKCNILKKFDRHEEIINLSLLSPCEENTRLYVVSKLYHYDFQGGLMLQLGFLVDISWLG